MRSPAAAVALVAALLLSGCRSPEVAAPPAVAEVPAKPPYQMTEAELDAHLAAVHTAEPDFRRRLVALARANVGQPYALYLLGEAPFEQIDPQPVYALAKSDCVVFAEHAVAMAMSRDFPTFLRVLQRVRYRDGAIGVRTRNHYTEADWNRNNVWLCRDVTTELDPAAVRFTQRVDRAKFFRGRYKLAVDAPTETIQEAFVPYEHLDAVKPKLRSGDLVNFVKGQDGGGFFVHHVGVVDVRPGGEVVVIHSTEPAVREEPLDAYVARAKREAPKLEAKGKPRGYGMKFLRLADDPWAALRAVDGPDAPRVSVPEGSPVTFEQFVATVAPQK